MSFEPRMYPSSSEFSRDYHDGRSPPLEFELHPAQTYYMADPGAQTFDETEFGFIEDRPIIGLNLAHKQVPNQAAVKDPMADIKKREQDLQNERVARETEL